MEKVTITKLYNEDTQTETFVVRYSRGIGEITVPPGTKLEKMIKDAFIAVICEYLQAGT